MWRFKDRNSEYNAKTSRGVKIVELPSPEKEAEQHRTECTLDESCTDSVINTELNGVRNVHQVHKLFLSARTEPCNF